MGKRVAEFALQYVGYNYLYGGKEPETGFDCSGLVCWSYDQVGIQLPRSARDQIMFGLKVDKKADLKPGDIVVFKGTRGRTGWHSGIYTGEGRFVHSPSTGKTVTESRLDEDYYAQRFVGARRIPRDGSASEMYARYVAEQRANALTAKSSKKSRGQLLAASGKAGGKGKASAKSSGKKGGAVVASAGSVQVAVRFAKFAGRCPLTSSSFRGAVGAIVAVSTARRFAIRAASTAATGTAIAARGDLAAGSGS